MTPRAPDPALAGLRVALRIARAAQKLRSAMVWAFRVEHEIRHTSAPSEMDANAEAREAIVRAAEELDAVLTTRAIAKIEAVVARRTKRGTKART